MKENTTKKMMEMMDDLTIEELAVDVANIEDIITLNKLIGIDTTELELDVLEQKRSEF
jgi:hypothetical protein